ncbi:hypothetical protein LguiA_000220 [Lonicera macranthoides]
MGTVFAERKRTDLNSKEMEDREVIVFLVRISMVCGTETSKLSVEEENWVFESSTFFKVLTSEFKELSHPPKETALS